MRIWNVGPWGIPAVLNLVAHVLAWAIVLWSLARAMNGLSEKMGEGAGERMSTGVDKTTDEWFNVCPPQTFTRKSWWKYVGLWFNNLPGSLLVGYAVSTGRWWVLILTVASWYWAGVEFKHQVALDQSGLAQAAKGEKR